MRWLLTVGRWFYAPGLTKLRSNLRVNVVATCCVWSVAILAFALSLIDASGSIVFSLVGALGVLCTYLLLVAFRSDEEQDAGMRVSWARTLWERVSNDPMPQRGDEEDDSEYAARVFSFAQKITEVGQQDVHESEDFRQALDGMDLAVLAFDGQGMAILANRAAPSCFA